ncbi:MAG: hypothetical protein IAF94_14110 [Pirellulaceae bacterium]|nr:hypothetical protein [Pirellulaceae bacterium]
MSENLHTIDAVFWWTVIIAGILWALWRTHIRNCEETPPLDAKPSAADEIASRQLMKPSDR